MKNRKHVKNVLESKRGRPGKARTYLRLPFAYRVRRKNFYLFLATGAGLMALTLLIPWAIFQYADDDGIAKLSETRPDTSVVSGESENAPLNIRQGPRPTQDGSIAEDSTDAVSSLESILDEYRSANGLQDLRSLLVKGSYIEDGRAFEMKLAAKAPNLVSKNLTDEGIEMICRYDGSQATIEVAGAGDGGVLKKPLEDEIYRKAILLEGAFFSLAKFSPDLTLPRLSLLADQAYDGKECWTIVSQLPEGPEIRHLIDRETGLEVVRYLNFTMQGTSCQISIHFSDFRRREGLRMPHAYTLKVNGTIRGRAIIDSIQTNPGLMPWMF